MLNFLRRVLGNGEKIASRKQNLHWDNGVFLYDHTSPASVPIMGVRRYRIGKKNELKEVFTILILEKTGFACCRQRFR